ncbi:hypothetical protein [Sanguibacter antarcticus]|uniref:Tse2 ADP-ribosyltransferase toxin domain-containing protein n=1 Tax=Sanguibacter antarcticus TaxID=372484 RepID=A0A2A9E479_9MICO|nr:hypothetical protein [Sanguibacter antarcticus]PFG33351.1 hypothetical protein ATL42_1221 [Sanguibacter antarcticus]
MPVVYRGMLPDVPPLAPLHEENNANALGVRVNPPSMAPDVESYLENEEPWVNPVDQNGDPQGISVATGSGCNLPVHRRPRDAPWNGSGRVGLLMWELDTMRLVPAHLALMPAPLPDQPHHAVIGPAVAMSLATYRGYIAATANDWAISPDPAVACAAALGGPVMMQTHLDRLSVAVATGADPADLVKALIEANASGLSAAEIVAGVQAQVLSAEHQGNSDGAESLREILDRVHGYCAPAYRIPLT